MKLNWNTKQKQQKEKKAMGNLEQTPVDWLIAQLTESGHLWITDKPDDMNELSLIIKKAKQMEAIELFKTYCNGFNKSRTALVFNKRDSYARLHLKEKFNIDFIKIIKQKL